MFNSCVRAIALLGFIGLVGCAFPIANNEPYQSKDKAVILVGVAGDETLRYFHVRDDGTQYRLTPPAEDGMYAFSFPLGRPFQIVEVVAPPNSLAHIYRYALLTNAPSLTPDKVGIYYYGVIVSTHGSVSVSDKLYAQLMKEVREKYKNVFDKLEPVNFK